MKKKIFKEKKRYTQSVGGGGSQVRPLEGPLSNAEPVGVFHEPVQVVQRLPTGAQDLYWRPWDVRGICETLEGRERAGLGEQAGVEGLLGEKGGDGVLAAGQEGEGQGGPELEEEGVEQAERGRVISRDLVPKLVLVVLVGGQEGLDRVSGNHELTDFGHELSVLFYYFKGE